jgi:hypothetical protein
LKILVEAKTREREVVHTSMCVTAPLSEFCRVS